jgi:hypothetical protein
MTEYVNRLPRERVATYCRREWDLAYRESRRPPVDEATTREELEGRMRGLILALWRLRWMVGKPWGVPPWAWRLAGVGVAQWQLWRDGMLR